MDYKNLFDFTGKKVLVTGGTGTLGAEFAYAFASCGADVVITGRDRQKAENVLKRCISHGNMSEFIQCDLSDVSKIADMVERTSGILGGIDILCNHAGFSIRKPAADCTEEDWDRLIGIDLKAPFFIACEAAKIMKENKWGRIINTASVSSARGHKNLSIYASAKGGISQMTKVLANEWAAEGVTVNAVAPGYVPSAQTSDLINNKKKKRELLARIPLGRFGKPEEIAAAVLFLASPGGSYITGQTIYIEGGRLID
ncbi:MAG: SDR family NAD(P)-dependent oxidoreductase [Synergistaceae bacterium]